jgi:WD40 repeat protein
MVELATLPLRAEKQERSGAGSQRRSSILPEFPYPGIRPFQKDEWPIFCGRQRIVDDLLHILGEARFLPVLGTSGCGKSSLIKAGLIATLERESGRLGASWVTAEMRPANAPMWGLAEALWAATHPDEQPAGNAPPPEKVAALRAILGQGPGGIARVLDSYGFPADRNLLLHVDQFEELFRFGSLGGEAEAETFVDQLIDVFDGQPRGIYVVSTMRTDFIADCARFPRLADAFNQTGYLLRHMTPAELREAIERPARLYRGRVEPQLVDRLVRDGGRDQDQLPVIEHALMWMWIRTGKPVGATLTLDDYLSKEVGGIEGALSQHADQIYEGLAAAALGGPADSRDLRPVAKRLFQALSDTDRGGRVIRRPVPFGELCAVADAAPEYVAHVIDEFRKPGCSFLMPPSGKPLEEKTVVDVSHEALIRQWSKMKGATGDIDWVEEEQKDGESWQMLAQAARRFHKDPKRLLAADESTEYQAWWRNRAPNPAWCRRYGRVGEDLFKDAGRLLQKSERCRRRGVVKVWTAVCVAALIAIGAVGFAAERAVEQAELTKQKLWTTRSLKEAGQSQTTNALVLARAATLAANADIGDVGADAAAYFALTRTGALANYPQSVSADISPDQRFAALAGDGTIRIVGLSTMATTSIPGPDGDSVDNVAIGPEGALFAVTYWKPDQDKLQGEIWDARQPAKLSDFQAEGSARSLWFSPDGRWLGVSDNKGARLIEVKSGLTRAEWEQGNLGSRSLVFSPDSRYLAAVAEGGAVFLVRLEEPFARVPHLTSGGGVGIAAFDPSARWLAIPTAQWDENTDERRGGLVLIDLETGDEKPVEALGLVESNSVAFSADGKWLAEGSPDGVYLLDVQTGLSSKIATYDGAVNWLTFSPQADATFLAVASEDGMAHVMQAPSWNDVAALPTGSAFGIGFVNAGRQILTMGRDDVVRVWQFQPMIPAQRYGANSGDPSTRQGAVTTPSGTRLRYSSISSVRQNAQSDTAILAIDHTADGPLVLASMDKGAELFRPGGSPDPINLPGVDGKHFSRAISGVVDGARHQIVLAARDGRLLSVTIGANPQAPPDDLGTLEATKGSSDGDPVTIGIEENGTVVAVRGAKWVEFGADDEPRSTEILGDDGTNLAVDAYGRRVLRYRATEDGSRLWLANLRGSAADPVYLRLLDPADPPLSGAFSRDGRLVAVVHQKGTVGVWDVRRRVAIAKFGVPGQRLLVPGFTPNADSVIVAAADGSVYKWPLIGSRDELLQRIEAAVPKGLTDDEIKQILAVPQE